MSFPDEARLQVPGRLCDTIQTMHAILPSGSLPQHISPYMQELIAQTGGPTGPIGLQFIAQPQREQSSNVVTDPLLEEVNEVAPGMIHKYPKRVLWTISRFCATYCRFCFRGRVVGLPVGAPAPSQEAIARKPYLDAADLATCYQYLDTHPDITEVILSGGDPFIAPQPYLTGILAQLAQRQEAGTLRWIRIHTRAVVTNPFSIQPWHYEALKQAHLPHIVLHVNHPSELTAQVCAVLSQLRAKTGAMLYSQSVLLAGVNDSVEVLEALFSRLVDVGVHPYYLHYNDPVSWARHFTVPPDEAIALWTALRPRLSGIAATAKFVIDTPYGKGKVAIPEGGFTTDYDSFIDFSGTRHSFAGSSKVDGRGQKCGQRNR